LTARNKIEFSTQYTYPLSPSNTSLSSPLPAFPAKTERCSCQGKQTRIAGRRWCFFTPLEICLDSCCTMSRRQRILQTRSFAKSISESAWSHLVPTVISEPQRVMVLEVHVWVRLHKKHCLRQVVLKLLSGRCWKSVRSCARRATGK
jgi:hypothetical protein